MYIPFNHLGELVANFEPFRKIAGHMYTLVNRLISGKTYIDLFSSQFIATPILVDSTNFNISGTTAYDSKSQIPNIPSTVQVLDYTNSYLVTAPNTFVSGMPIKFTTSAASGTMGNLVNDNMYWVLDSTAGTALSLGRFYNSTPITMGTTAGNHYITMGQPLQQLNESSLLRRNTTYPTPKKGSLAIGDIVGTKSTLYYNDGSQYRMVKLGYPGGQGYYNNGATFNSTYTGWLHSNGSYKIITSSNQIKIQFNWLEVVEDITGSRDIIEGVKTVPLTDYNLLITNSGSTGLGTIDTGAIIANTAYYVYVVYNPESNQYGAVLSMNPNKPTFPTDNTTSTQYRFYQRLGWIRTDTTGAFLPSLQVDHHFCFLQCPTPTFSVGFYGSGTSPDISLLDINEGMALNYPRVEFLDRVHWILGFNGTGLNGYGTTGVPFSTAPDPRIYYINGQPINKTVSTKMEDSDGIVRQVCQIYNDFPVNKNRNTVFNLSQTQGTNYTNVSGYIYGFVLNSEITL